VQYNKLLVVLMCLKLLGIVHRDFRPANILVMEEDGSVTLIDFGYCSYCDEDVSFKGGKDFTSRTVLDNLITLKEKPFSFSPEDDLHSWIRVWVLMSNPVLRNKFRQLKLSEDGNSTRAIKDFCGNLKYFPNLDNYVRF
jgi:serine/threonine protein kinase